MSILLIVKDIPKIIIIIDKNKVCSFSKSEKNARSEITSLSLDTATKPLKPIKKTIGIIIKKEITKLFFKTLLSRAA